MQKKGKAKKSQQKTTPKKSASKITVGEDEFCPTCMEWRAYDEVTGKCKVCGRQIKKVGSRSRAITDEYDLKDFTVEHDDQQDTNEY
jgi:ribosomal protein L32